MARVETFFFFKLQSEGLFTRKGNTLPCNVMGSLAGWSGAMWLLFGSSEGETPAYHPGQEHSLLLGSHTHLLTLPGCLGHWGAGQTTHPGGPVPTPSCGPVFASLGLSSLPCTLQAQRPLPVPGYLANTLTLLMLILRRNLTNLGSGDVGKVDAVEEFPD